MPLRNMWSLQPGEVLVAEEILNKIPGTAVYFPVRDVGVDLLVAKSKQHCGVQVKESRYYSTKKWHNSWHQVSEKNLYPQASSKRTVPDFFVFLTYMPDYGKTKLSAFKELYIVLPIRELIARVGAKRQSGEVYSFCFSFDGQRVSDIREEYEGSDYTPFLDNWKLIEQALS